MASAMTALLSMKNRIFTSSAREDRRKGRLMALQSSSVGYSTPEQFMHVLQGITDVLLVVDRQWRIIYANAAAEPYLSCSSNEVLGKVLWDEFSEVINAPVYTTCLEAMQERIQKEYEFYNPRFKRWFHLRLYPIPDGLCMYTHDITKRKQSELLLQASEDRLRISVENLFHCFGMYTAVRDASGTIVDFRVDYVNENACRNNHMTKEEQIGKNVFELIPQLRSTNLLEFYRQVVETGTPFTIDNFVYQGEWHGEQVVSILEIRVTKLGDGVTVVWRDISERKKAEMALQRSEARVKRLIEANIIGVISADEEYITEANDAFLTMVGYTRDDLQQRQLNWRQMTPLEYWEQDERSLRELFTYGFITPMEKEYYRKDGSRVPILVGVAMLPGEPLQSIGFIMDISAQKELERRKDEFISIASHELKTPLASLKGLTQLFKRKISKNRDADPVAYFTRMEDQVDYLTRLINDLLDVSKMQAGKLEYVDTLVDLDALVREVVEIFSLSEDLHHTITITGSTHAHVNGDKDRLRQVLTNMLTNAVKYSPQADKVEVLCSSNGTLATIDVRDYGMGIPPEQQARVFERFYRSDRPESKRVPGLGMGLYIVQEIIAHHGGTIHLESAVGQGSTFSISLPIVQA